MITFCDTPQETRLAPSAPCEAANGDEAWDMFTQYQPQVLVTDRMMPPGLDGLQLCRAVRDSEQNI